MVEHLKRGIGSCGQVSSFSSSSIFSLSITLSGVVVYLPSFVERSAKGYTILMQMVHIEEINARVANLVEIPVELSDNMKSALRSIGIKRLYSHQV